MKETILYCDICGRKFDVKSYSFLKNREFDGNGYQDIFDHKDLCFKCLLNFARQNTEKEIFESK